MNNFAVIVSKASAANIEGYGSPDEFLNKFSYLLGKQAFDGEGGRRRPC